MGVYGDLARESKKEEHHKLRQNKMDTMEQVAGLGDTYTRRKWRRTATSGGAPVKDCDGLAAWGGVGDVGNERGCRGLLIGAEKEGNRGLMARIEGSPELRRRDGRERDSGKKEGKGSGVCRWLRGSRTSERAKKTLHGAVAG